MQAIDDAILPHHHAAAAMWDRGGKNYDNVSFAVSDALKHAAQRLDARAGERILDVATGTGWSARNVARSGARVTGVDISRELLAAARDLSSTCGRRSSSSSPMPSSCRSTMPPSTASSPPSA